MQQQKKRQYQTGDSAAVTLNATTTTPYVPEPLCQIHTQVGCTGTFKEGTNSYYNSERGTTQN